MEKALEIKNFTKVYGKGEKRNVAVDDISFSVEKGEFFGLLGPNGAGKSTTIHAITGIARIEYGSLEIFGTDVVEDYREARKKVGLSGQEFNIDIFEEVRDILNFVAGYYGIPKKEREARVEELLDQFNLQKHAEKKFQELSGGLKRRVMIARALVHDPELLILDEPTAGVDVELRHELWGYLRELNEDGKTIILTSHYLEEIELLCERIGIMSKGKLAGIDSKEEYTKGGKRLEDAYFRLTSASDDERLSKK